jgi:peptidoglycan/LPS O-acetylase OafA/YrhL
VSTVEQLSKTKNCPVPKARKVSVAAQSKPQPARLRGLDGLRAIAVGAVLLYHADISWVKGGYLGVDLFFVISGFLITGLLADQRTSVSGAASGLLWAFYWRRAKRLLPAAWLMITAAVIAAALFANDALPRLRTDALASFFYVTNWELIRHGTSYFESFGRQPLLMHLWSLAIEEQFYLLWAPLVLWGLLRLGRVRLVIVTLALAALSATWMGFMAAQTGYPDHSDPSRLYFGTDTHGFQLLFGAVLGLLWQPNRIPATKAKHGWALLGLFALLAMLALFALLGEETAWLYPWGFLLSVLVSVVLITAATHRGSAFGLWLDNCVMRWLGERSYGIYLWHWPIFMLLRPGLDLPMLPPAWVAFGNIILTVSIAALSYTYVESPIRHGLLERTWRKLHTAEKRLAALGQGSALLAGIVLPFGIVLAILLRAPNQTLPAPDVRAAITGEFPSATTHAATNAPAAAMPSAVPPMATSVVPPVVTPAIPPVVSPVVTPVVSDQPSVPSYNGTELTAVGDSVLLGSSRMLAAMLKGIDLHATVGWQTADVLDQIKKLDRAGQLRSVVLVHLGTNGYISEKQLREILSLLANIKRIILVNTHVPRRWMDANDELIGRIATDYPNVVVVDWRTVSDGHREYFVSDGVHLTFSGQRAFIGAIMNTGNLVPTPKTELAKNNTDDADQKNGRALCFEEQVADNFYVAGQKFPLFASRVTLPDFPLFAPKDAPLSRLARAEPATNKIFPPLLQLTFMCPSFAQASGSISRRWP